LAAAPGSASAATKIIYVCGNNLCRVNPDTGAKSTLTTDGTDSSPYRSPSLSRDGTKLAFLHGAAGPNDRVDGIFVSDANAANRVGPFKNTGSTSGPTASQVAMKPDGSEVAYVHVYNPDAYQMRYDLERFAANGSNQQFIASKTFYVSYGPEGYLTNSMVISPIAVCLLDPPSSPGANDAGCRRNVASDSARDLYAPAASPDGARVAAKSVCSGCDDKIELFSYATGAPTGFLTAGPNDDHPAFSPDGSQLAFSRGPTGTSDIYVISTGGPAGSERKLLTGGSSPTWGPAPEGSPGPTPGPIGPTPGPTPRPIPGAPGGRKGPCGLLTGTALKRCQLEQQHQAALSKCRKLKGKKRPGCTKKANRDYRRALAALKCQAIKNPRPRATCLRTARKKTR
jgi:hypothetical protein